MTVSKILSTAMTPLRAAREELVERADVERALSRRERSCEEAMSLAESELNSTRKLAGYVRIAMDTVRRRIAELEA